jgi:hypothetical protein
MNSNTAMVSTASIAPTSTAQLNQNHKGFSHEPFQAEHSS